MGVTMNATSNVPSCPQCGASDLVQVCTFAGPDDGVEAVVYSCRKCPGDWMPYTFALKANEDGTFSVLDPNMPMGKPPPPPNSER